MTVPTLIRSFILSSALCIGFASSVHATVVTHVVDGQDNLFFDDWGHVYQGGQWEYDALGTGMPAQVVSDASGAFDFMGIASIDIFATGTVVDAGSTATDADGHGWLFRGLDVYSLIGIWSSSATSIDPLGNAFVVGTSNTFGVPSGGASRYLFLAENDGIFHDNSGQYDVTISFDQGGNPTAVPTPGALAIFAAGLVGLGLSRRRENR
ncbi:MAG: hypothetical protein K0U93_04105 [Gammaproteobacteria bacterium]|nr:hypothetical protein [Gammaproteobacteria bacterium]